MGGISIVGTLCSLCLHALYVLCCNLNIPANNYTHNNLLLDTSLEKLFSLQYCVPRTFVDTLLTPLPNMVLWVIINCLFILRSGRSEGGLEQSRGRARHQPRPRHRPHLRHLRNLRGEVLHAAARLGRGQRGLQEVGEDQGKPGEVAFLHPAQA